MKGSPPGTWYERRISPSSLWVALTATLLLMVLFRVLPPTDVITLDAHHRGYTASEAYELLSSYTEAQRIQYAVREVTLDVAFPVAYGTFWFLCFTLCLRRALGDAGFWQRLFQITQYLPVPVVVLDLAENLCAATLTLSLPPARVESWDSLARTAAFFSYWKWLGAAIATTLALLALAILALNGGLASNSRRASSAES